MAVRRPHKETIESNADGGIAYSPLKSWLETERFTYSTSDGRGGIATATVTVIVQNHPAGAADQDVTVNANSPIKIKLEAKDPDDDKLKFVLVTKPSHGRIVQFSSSTGTLAYVPDENYDGKDDFAFKVHDETEFSKNAKVSIKIEKNERLANDQVQGSDQQQKKETSINPPQMRKRSLKRRTMAIHLLAIRANSHLVQDTEQQIKNQKEEQQPTSEADKSTSGSDTTSSGDSPPTHA
jgi:Bacterial Ig domain